MSNQANLCRHIFLSKVKIVFGFGCFDITHLHGLDAHACVRVHQDHGYARGLHESVNGYQGCL